MTAASFREDLATARGEHLVPGREIHLRDMRGYRFCEVGLVTSTGKGGAIANIWNTTGASDPTPEALDAVDADALAREHQALHAWLSPVRHSMFDQVDVREVGDDRTFGMITATWTGAADETTFTQVAGQGSYHPGYVCRDSTLTFSMGSEIYLLDAPDGEVFIMSSRSADADLSEEDLAHLGGRLDLPGDWGFRTEMLDEDLKVSSSPDNLTHVLHDNLHNVYQGSDAGRAFSRFCRQYERW